MNFAKWLDTFVSEKGFDLEDGWVICGPTDLNYILLSHVLDAIKSAPPHEQASIKEMIVRIDFHNGDVLDYFRHLAQAIAI